MNFTAHNTVTRWKHDLRVIYVIHLLMSKLLGYYSTVVLIESLFQKLIYPLRAFQNPSLILKFARPTLSVHCKPFNSS